MSTSTVGGRASCNISQLISDARHLLPQRPTINQIMEAGHKVMESYGLGVHAGILADIGDGLISLLKWESENLKT